MNNQQQMKDFRLFDIPGEWLLSPILAKRYAGQVVSLPGEWLHPETRERALRLK